MATQPITDDAEQLSDERFPLVERGRPTVYQDDYPEIARKLCDGGFTDSEVADFFDVHVATVYRWKVIYPDFCEALKLGKVNADDRMEMSLYRKGIGYDYIEEQAIKVKTGQHTESVEVVEVRRHQPADATAQIFYLKNRRAREWRDKREVAFETPEEPQFDIRLLTPEQREQYRQLLIAMMPQKQIEGEYQEVS